MEAEKNFGVPCGTCQHCCKHEWIIIDPAKGDVLELYDTTEIVNPINGQPAHALKHKDNGDCIYLSETGCTIHGRHTAICRAFDCRRFYLNMQSLPRAERRRQLKTIHRFQESFDIGKRMQDEFPV